MVILCQDNYEPPGMNKPQNKIPLRGCHLRKGIFLTQDLDEEYDSWDDESEDEDEEENDDDDDDEGAEEGKVTTTIVKLKGGPEEDESPRSSVGITMEHSNKKMKLFLMTDSQESQTKWFKAMETFTKLTI